MMFVRILFDPDASIHQEEKLFDSQTVNPSDTRRIIIGGQFKKNTKNIYKLI
jgi:hypothetical protein